MTFQLICLCLNLTIAFLTIRHSKRIAKAKDELTKLYDEIASEYEKLQSIHHEIDRHGKSIHLKINLDEIDIDRVKDPATKNFLAMRRLITTFNPN